MLERAVVHRVGLGALLALVALSLLLLAPRAGAATTVVNGDFEAGDLSGWSTAEDGDGQWLAYSDPGFGSNPFAPPQGDFAATTFQTGPGLNILYQDVDLGTGPEEVLRLFVYYSSEAALTTPEPASLSPAVTPNQQYRIDVMDPTAPLDSVDPEDILAPVFATKTGDPQTMAPKIVSANLTKFGGQTVRLRMAEVDNQEVFNAGVDAVAIGPVPPPAPPLLPAPPAPPANTFTVGKLKQNKKNGTATLKVTVPGAGILTATDAKKKSPKRIKKVSVTSVAASTVTLKLKPTGAGKKTLKNTGKLQFRALLSFTPSGGAAGTQAFKGKLKLTPPA